MTSPDFSGIPATAPGVVRPRMSTTEAQLAENRRLTEALTRRDLSNAGVGAGGRLRAYYKDGTRGVLIGTDPADGANKVRLDYDSGVNAFALQPGAAVYGSRTQLNMRDLSGRTFIVTDEVAGFGLSHPSFSYVMAPFEAIGAGMPTTQPTAAVLAQGLNFTYNPCMYMGARVRFDNGATAFTANVFLNISCSDGTQLQSSVTSFAVAANAFSILNVNKQILLRSQDMSVRCTAEWRIYRTGSDATLVAATAYCPLAMGVSQAFYEANPGLH